MNQRFCNGMIHVIKSGDNLYQLSRKYRVPLALILRANPYVDVYNLQPGQEICIPMNRPSGPGAFPGTMPGRPGPGPGPGPGPRPEPMPGRPEPRQEPMPDRPEAREMEEGELVADYEENDREIEENPYYTDGTKSLGAILKDCGMSVEEFFERNDPDRIIIGPDVMLDVPKKV